MSPSWLPPLPSLLPSNLQKRFLSYALTHVLGTFLEPQTFSLEKPRTTNLKQQRLPSKSGTQRFESQYSP
jgi:hypothetical protein